MLDYLNDLCTLCGASGNEKDVSAYLSAIIGDKGECQTDVLGNLLVFKKGKMSAKNKVMLAAHMDEVGVIVTYVTDEGYLKFTTVGGIDRKVLLGRSIVFPFGIYGIIGVKPIHMLEGDEKKAIPEMDKLYIDIGAKNKEEALNHVPIGSVGVFDSDYLSFGDHKIKCRALDDRVGCAIMLDMILSDLEYDTYFAFTVQEEIGTRGANTAAFSIAPDYAIVLETTTAADIIDVEEHKKVCKLGEGCAISFMDRTTLYNPDLFKEAFELAKEKGIKAQPKTVVAGGNDAGVIHKSREGVKVLTINTPCRYLHSASCVIDERDMLETRKLAESLAMKYANA